MNTNISKVLLSTGTMIILGTTSGLVFAEGAGGGSTVGGGGDATEMRVNEIRADILNWIKDGGSARLKFSQELNRSEYDKKMSEILKPNKVIISFVEKDDKNEEELQVKVNGVPKTCRGFISRFDTRPHMLCNISRFSKTSEADQYRLIHHEYAGLVGIETNDGPASDYKISNQLTDNLEATTVLRLSIKGNGLKPSKICGDFYSEGLEVAKKLFENEELVLKKVPLLTKESLKELYYKIAIQRKVLTASAMDLDNKTAISHKENLETLININEYSNLSKNEKVRLQIHELLVLSGLESDDIYVYSDRLMSVFPNYDRITYPGTSEFNCYETHCVLGEPNFDNIYKISSSSDPSAVCAYFGFKKGGAVTGTKKNPFVNAKSVIKMNHNLGYQEVFVTLFNKVHYITSMVCNL